MRIVVDIGDELRKRAKVYAAENSITLQEVTKRAIEEYLDRRSAPPVLGKTQNQV